MIPVDSNMLRAVSAMSTDCTPTPESLARGRGRLRRARISSQVQDAEEDSDLSSELSCDTDITMESSSSSFQTSTTSKSSLEEVSGGRGHGRGNSAERGFVKGKRLGRGRGYKTNPELSLSSSDLSTCSSLSPACSLSSLRIVNELLPPQQRVAGYFPGSVGRLCKLESNHFSINLKIPEGMIYMYDVVVEPPWKRPYRKSDKKVYHEAINTWKSVCPAVAEEQNCWVFDGYKQLYSTRKHGAEEFKKILVKVWSKEDEREVEFVIRDVARVADIRVSQEIAEWAAKGRSGSIPQDAIQALDIVLKQAVNTDLSWESIGRSYFPTPGNTLDLGFGKEAWCGIFSSIRPVGWKDNGVLLTLNVDTAHKPATKNMPLVAETQGYLRQVLCDGKAVGVIDLNRGLTDEQRKLFSKDMEGLKVRYELPTKDGVRKRQYRVLEVRRKPAKDEMINVDGKNVSVVRYFFTQYGVELRFPNLPCLWVGARDRSTFIPMEFCTMLAQAMPRRKKLPDEAIATMIRQTAVKPLDRQKKILESLDKNNARYKTDPYANEFGISVSGTMSKLTGRILDPPSIEYKDNGKDKNIVNINKSNPGKWFQGDKNKYLEGSKVDNWAVLDMAHLSDTQYKEVVQGFCSVGKENGIKFQADKVVRSSGSMRDMDEAMATIEDSLVRIGHSFESNGKTLDLVLVVFSFKAGGLYDKIKHLGDMKLGITTQCCLKNNLFKGGSLNKQVIANVCMKVNSKLGGLNHVLAKACRPKLLRRPVMIMGADVSHPAPEYRGLKPSIAAVVASVEPKAVNFEVQVRIQDMGIESNEEVIKDMKNVTKSLLQKFYEKNNGRKPEKIVMFRDGCSEGQFLTVLVNELLAMREACKELEEGYEPPITYLVVQKRHHTRFFPTDSNKYRNGNALAGTVVDQGINHPTEGDFYLVSHEGIQGTSRPCHYQVLWDDSNFTADDLEVLAYYLCHLYSRCTRSVSYPTPTYYAHLVADRARKHHNELAQFDCGSSSGYSAGSGKMSEAKKREIKEAVEKGVQKPMYFV